MSYNRIACEASEEEGGVKGYNVINFEPISTDGCLVPVSLPKRNFPLFERFVIDNL